MNTLPHHASEDKPYFVYELVDPRDVSVFYVGITLDLYARYKQHMHCDGTNVAKDQRIQEIVASGHLPIMRTRECVKAFEQALERESYWIAFYLNLGTVLTNLAGVPVSAGRGVRGNSHKEKPKNPLISLLDLKSYRLGETAHNARQCSFEEFVAFARSVVEIADPEDLRTVFDRRDFLNWCLEKKFLYREGDRLMPSPKPPEILA